MSTRNAWIAFALLVCFVATPTLATAASLLPSAAPAAVGLAAHDDKALLEVKIIKEKEWYKNPVVIGLGVVVLLLLLILASRGGGTTIVRP